MGRLIRPYYYQNEHSSMNSHQLTLIANPSAESGALETLPDTEGLKILSKEELLSNPQIFSPSEKLICTSESVLDLLIDSLDLADPRAHAIQQMKDKHLFRNLTSAINPDFYFKEFHPSELESLSLDPESRYVLKPSKGCFGTGVRTFTGSADLNAIGHEIIAEIERNSSVLSDSVLSNDRLILEEYIAGEEYAVDVFFDSQGEVHITNIFHHPMPQNSAYLHMLYYSSRDTHNLIYPLAIDFFEQLSSQLDLRNMPIHSEFRLVNGALIPIELNPMRFGGMGLTNLNSPTLGINAYQQFIEESKRDWAATWNSQPELVNVFFIAYNGTHIDKTTHQPNWPLLRDHFSEIIREIPFNYQQQLTFGILILREEQSILAELLAIDFDDYFLPI